MYAIMSITLESLESLAAQFAADESAERARLVRLVTAYARIISARELDKFRSMPTIRADEDGHWDSSYPPRVVYKARTGPRLLMACAAKTEDVATEGGAYYAWRRVTTDPGVFVAPDGAIWGCREEGTGRVGRFAAHPGDCDVDCTLEWFRRDDATIAELRAAECVLRKVAFPMVAAATAA